MHPGPPRDLGPSVYRGAHSFLQENPPTSKLNETPKMNSENLKHRFVKVVFQPDWLRTVCSHISFQAEGEISGRIYSKKFIN